MIQIRFLTLTSARAAVFVAAALLAFGALARPAAAQVDDELAGGSREGREWGEAPPESQVDDPVRIMVNLGSGFGLRLNPNEEFGTETLAPVNLHLGSAIFLPGRDIRHGLHLGVTTNVIDDGTTSSNIPAFNQYVVTPSYVLLVPLKYMLGGTADWMHIQGRFGVPLAFGAQQGNTDAANTFVFSPGLEVAGAFHFKFLSGLGLYFEATASAFYGVADNIFALVSLELGLLWDYELLP